jgi:membrane-bound lytic murein transglycosylase D
MIQRVLDEEGVPRELIHLAQAESGFIPRAVSRKAAGGMWQFLAWRGQEYGLNRTPYLDERMDPEKATRAAARHLRDLYQEFGDWYLALAAYNCGPVTVEKAVERTGYADFWELRNRGVLPLETTNYVPIILAMTIMDKNAAEYGIQDLQPDPALEYDTVEIAAPTSMTLVSDITEVSLPELAALNPSILKRVAPAGYALHVPKGAGDALIPALESIPPEHREAWRMHRVGPGETLAEIGKRYGVAVNGIVALNNLPSTETVEGDRLVIPAALRAEQPERRVASSPSKKAPARRQASTRNSATTASRKNGPASGKSSAQAAKRSASAPAKKAASKPSLTATASSPEPRALVAETGTR